MTMFFFFFRLVGKDGKDSNDIVLPFSWLLNGKLGM